jgi:hypothetical protein
MSDAMMTRCTTENFLVFSASCSPELTMNDPIETDNGGEMIGRKECCVSKATPSDALTEDAKSPSPSAPNAEPTIEAIAFDHDYGNALIEPSRLHFE